MPAQTAPADSCPWVPCDAWSMTGADLDRRDVRGGYPPNKIGTRRSCAPYEADLPRDRSDFRVEWRVYSETDRGRQAHRRSYGSDWWEAAQQNGSRLHGVLPKLCLDAGQAGCTLAPIRLRACGSCACHSGAKPSRRLSRISICRLDRAIHCRRRWWAGTPVTSRRLIWGQDCPAGAAGSREL